MKSKILDLVGVSATILCLIHCMVLSKSLKSEAKKSSMILSVVGKTSTKILNFESIFLASSEE